MWKFELATLFQVPGTYRKYRRRRLLVFITKQPVPNYTKIYFATIPIVRLYAIGTSFTNSYVTVFRPNSGGNLAQLWWTYTSVHVGTRAKRQYFLYLAETARKIEYLLTKFSDRKISIWRLLNICAMYGAQWQRPHSHVTKKFLHLPFRRKIILQNTILFI